MTEAWKAWEGRTVGGAYPLRRYLGGSDCSAVFLTEHPAGPGEPRPAAIKLIPAGAAAPAQLARWEQAARLRHPNLLPLLAWGHGELDGASLLYVVMEYAEENLAEVVPARALTPEEGRATLGAILYALAFLHGRGLTHGRVRPSNILAASDQVRLSSDSIRPSGESEPAPPPPAPYDAPELARTGPTPSADVWSLGVTLVQALSQQLPQWNPAERRSPPLPASLPPPFLEIARHCLEPDPQKRWSVAQVAARLRPAPPISPMRPVPPPPVHASRRMRFLVPALGVAALLLIAVAARWLNRPDSPAPEAAVEVSEAVAPPAASLPDSAEPPPRGLRAAVEPARPQAPQAAALSDAPALTPRPAPAPAAPPVAVARGEVARRVLPQVSQSALDTIRGTVRVVVRVEVSPEGKVTDAEFEFLGPSRYFRNAAMDAARQWEFTPAQVAGRAVESQWLLRFEFTNDETRAIPTPEIP